MTNGWWADARVRAHAAAAGAAPAVFDGSIEWTWSDLDRRVDALAAELVLAGAGRRDVVALVAEPSPAAIAALLAIGRLGAIAAPLPGGLSDAEVGAAMTMLRPRVVLHDAATARAVTATAATAGAPGTAGVPDSAGVPDTAGAPGPPVLVRLAVEAAARGAPTRATAAETAPAARDPADPAIVVLTSGTTGRPRGVLLSASALAASADAWLAALPPASGWILALGLGHVAGIGVVWRAIAAGVPIRIVPPSEPAALIDAIRMGLPASHVSLVPTQLVRALDLTEDAPPPSLRAVLLGGGPIPPQLVLRAIRAGWPVVPTYGLSEAGSGVTALPTAEAADHPSSAGRPLPGVQIRIDEPDAEGIGEIVVRTPARFLAYLGDAAGAAAGGWLRTGDLGRLDDAGRLTVIDRRTDRIVRGGENISPAEVESVLLAHPAVADAAVVGRPDALWGHVPVAAIVLRDPAADPGDVALASHCLASLAGPRVPVAFVRLASLPRTAGGKLRRGDVRDQIATGPARGPSPDSPGRGVAGRGVARLDIVRRDIVRPDGVHVAWHEFGDGSPAILLLHGTLSNGRQLASLASELVRSAGVRVLAVDRRGSGASRLAEPVPLDVGVHVADLVAILDAERIPAAVSVGISYGGALALELAARHPDRVLAVAAWEPPYGPLAAPDDAAGLLALAVATGAAHRSGGPARAAETFLRAVAGDAAWDRLSPRARAFVEGEGDGALVDVLLAGLDPDGLSGIHAPVAVLTGDASEPFYGPIADALVERIPGARRIRVPALGHAGPILDPATAASAIRRALADAGVLAAHLGPAPAAPVP